MKIRIPLLTEGCEVDKRKSHPEDTRYFYVTILWGKELVKYMAGLFYL